MHVSDNRILCSFHCVIVQFNRDGGGANHFMHIMFSVMKEFEELKVHVSKLESQIRDTVNLSHDGTCMLRIENISEIMRQYTTVTSQPFYTGRSGYKMCVRAHFMSERLSFSFEILRGDYDALLEWPFTNKVSFIIIDQTGLSPIVRTFKPCIDKPDNDMNIASGCPQFVELARLDMKCYGGENDTMFIKCIIHDIAKIYHP